MARTALVAIVLGVPLAANADPQSERTIAMDEVRMAAQAEVLAVGCGLKLNTKLRDMLRNDATIKLSIEALSGMEQFSRTYTLNLLHRHHRGICACLHGVWSGRSYTLPSPTTNSFR